MRGSSLAEKKRGGRAGAGCIGAYLAIPRTPAPDQPVLGELQLQVLITIGIPSRGIPQVISRIVRARMANIDPVSISSDGGGYTVSSSTERAAAGAISVMSSNASWPETIEHVESSGFDREDPLALHEAREEAARMALAGFD